jgi:hypothetical protein
MRILDRILMALMRRVLRSRIMTDWRQASRAVAATTPTADRPSFEPQAENLAYFARQPHDR